MMSLIPALILLANMALSMLCLHQLHQCPQLFEYALCRGAAPTGQARREAAQRLTFIVRVVLLKLALWALYLSQPPICVPPT